jgi:FMN-dependent NADH-azoreductase
MSGNPVNLLRVDASLNRESSVSRALADKVQAKLESFGPLNITTRDVADGLRIDSAWREAMLTPPEERTEQDKEVLAFSDALVAELQAADVLLISTPIYNFNVTSDLKGWVDHICRAGMTFKYTEHGPRGLLEGKKAIIVLASNGTGVHSDIDFAGRYLKQIMTFLNITDVSFVYSDQMKKFDPAEKMAAAEKQIELLSL